MAKFTPEEVTALQAGGNERAKQIYFKGWDPLRHSYPDSSNMHRLRDFIKHVYVDRKYTGEKSQENLPRIKLNDKEESYESKRSSSFRLEFITTKSSPGARSSPGPRSGPGPRSDNSSFRYVYDESRSPKYVRKYSRYGGVTRSPIKIEVVDNRFRDDEYRNRRLSNLESKLKQLSVDGQKNVERIQAPVESSSGEKITENDSSSQVTTSGGEGSVEEKPSEQKSNKSRSFNDSSIKSQASDTAIVPVQETPSMTQESENNWASFEVSNTAIVPVEETPSMTMRSSTTEPKPEATISNPLDLLLLELSGPFAPTTSGISEVPSGGIVPTTTTLEMDSTWDFPSTSMEAKPSNGAPPPQSELHETEDSIEVSHAHEPPNMQYPPSVSVGCSSIAQPTNSPNNATLNKEPSFSPSTHESSHAFTETSSKTTPNHNQDTRPPVGSQPNTMETKSSGRMELPEDLFSTRYLSGPAAHAGWQNLQHHVMGYGMQYYPNAMPPPALPTAPKYMNPFDITEGRSLAHATSCPTMESMNGVLPAVPTRTGLMHASSLGSLDTTVPYSASYPSPITGIDIIHDSIISGVCFDQHNNEDQHFRSQRVDTFNGFGSLDPIQQSYGGYGTHGIPNSFSNIRRNPFE
ncbi:ArfGap/RecO-like zinc finger protein, putative [Medicago truncatula]|uniref:ArfGap/RecO-like zinc finger protein, putative n=1 Tax=Medicago truncatula TaxID=3880 RepID=A0A072VEE4_MEDTR|nr:ArfGap/RecO-like zinc finger protein, putative [Medicago truncatula]